MVCCAFCSPNMLFFPLTPLKVYGFSRDDFTSRHHGSSFVLTSTPLLSRRRSILSLDSLKYSSCPLLQIEWLSLSTACSTDPVLGVMLLYGHVSRRDREQGFMWVAMTVETYLPCKSCGHLFIIKLFEYSTHYFPVSPCHQLHTLRAPQRVPAVLLPILNSCKWHIRNSFEIGSTPLFDWQVY